MAINKKLGRKVSVKNKNFKPMKRITKISRKTSVGAHAYISKVSSSPVFWDMSTAPALI